MDYGFKRAGILFLVLFFILQFSNIFAQTCVGDPNSLVLDDDFDGYSNGDETLNGTDKCSSLSVPLDFDADYISDMLDADDDNDGLNDIVDKFAQDKNNGATTNIPVYYKFQNPNNGGIGNSGFTGLMTTGATNYANLYSMTDLVIGGASNKFTVNNISSGDALGATNTQKNAFQFGVNTGAFPFNYTISSRVMTPFAAITPADFQSMGMFMGTGDQDNYLKISCASNGGIGGIEVVKEVAGVVTSNMYSASVLGSSQVNFYFTVNRAANTVQPAYSINGGASVNVGSAIAVPSSWLSNVLAVGIISTSRGATAFSASWDNIAVQPIEGNGQWQTINTNNTCVARHDCGFVMAGARPFLLGGHGVTTHYTENYNFSSKIWGTSGDVRDATPPEIITHTQAVQVRGFIYMACAFTGSFPNDIPLNKVYMYDPAYNYWYSGRFIPEDRRRGASASVVYNEKIYIIGGLKGGHTGGWTNYLDEYDPYSNTWTILPDAPHERDHFQAVVRDGKIYCIGGRKTGFGGSTYAETVVQTDVYDIENQTWSTLPSPECDIPTPRAGASVAIIGDEVFVIGGENASQTTALTTTEAFNVKTKTWRTVASLNTGRQGTQAIVNNYAIYIVGGTSNRGESPDLNSIEVFYPYGQTTATGTAYVRPNLGQLPSTNVDFGQVAIGTTATRTVTITNTGGTQAMIIKSIHLAQNSLTNFSVSYPYAIPFALNPGDSVDVQVTFQPNSTSNFIGTLYISNTGVSGDNMNYTFTGTGVTQQSTVRINCAGPQFTDGSSNVFSQDFFSQSGTSKISTAQPISGTTDDALFQDARSGAVFSYNIPVQNNTYTVKLYFAEIASNAVVGMNVFDVKIENSTKITALDLFTTAGLHTAYTRTFTIPVTDQMMNLDFIGSAGNASVSAIELIPAAVTQGVLTAVPMPLNFPETDLNSNSAPITVTLTNTGAASLTINSVSITGTNAANFVHTYGVTATTLIPGATKTFTVTFNPTAAGTRNATMNISNTGMNTMLSIPLKGTGSSTIEPCGYFVEQNGLLVMEVESEKASGYWTPNNGIPNYTGSEYYTWQGPNYFFEKGNGLLRYEFKITTPGKYRFRLRNRHPGPDPAHFNDIWIRFPDHGPTFEKNGQLMEEPGTGWWIGSMSTKDAWTYNIYGRRSTFWEIYVEFKDPGIYYVDLSGRVENFSIDRLVLYQMDKYTEWQACGSNPPQSPWEDCPSTPYTWYRDKDLDDYGDPNVTVQAVTKPGAGWIWNNQDCDDNQATVYPGAPEILDGRDNDCDGVVDDGALLNALNINCGGSEYTAVNGDLFQSDRLYKPSTTSVKFFNNTGDILNTDDDNLFKSERFNSQFTTSFTYNLKAAPGKFYKVSLYFAEQGTVTAAGQRVFNVTLEDSIVLNNFDIITAAGGYKTGYVYDAYVYLRDSTLNIKFTDVVGKAKINAIKAAIQPNVPPTFKVSPVFVTLSEDFTGTRLFNVTPDPVLVHEAYQTVTYSLSPATCSFCNVSINPTTGQVSITAMPNGNGLQVFTITANDGQAENNIATKTFQFKVLAVNDKPAFTLSGNVTTNKNFSGTIDVTATPAPVPADEQNQIVTYSISPASIPFANVSINSATGTVSITSVTDMYGTQAFTVTANDGQASNNISTQIFTLTVNNVTYPPTLDAIADVNINEDTGTQTVNLTGITAGQGQNMTLSVTAVSNNTPLIPNPSVNYTSPNATGLLSFAPLADKSGSTLITVTVSNGSLTVQKTFTVTVSPVNDAPAFTMSGNITVNEDFAGTQTVSTTPAPVPADEMSQTVVYSLSPSSVLFANVSINSATGQVSITSIANANGSQVFTVTANDGQSQNNTYSQTFTLIVNAVNDAPAFTLSGSITVDEDFAGTQTVSATPAPVPADEMSQTVVYSLSPASVGFANVSISSATGQVSITSIANANGSQVFTVTANDGQSQNNTSAQTFTLTVNPVNDAPTFTLSGNITVNEDFAGTQTVSATPASVPADEMSQTIVYSLSPASVSFANVSISSATGQVSITSIANASGSQQFTVTANDGQSQNNTYSQTFMLTINAVNDAPAFILSGNITVNEDFAGTQTVSATPATVPADEMSQTVVYSLSPVSVSFANVSINSATGQVSITLIANASGSQLFTVTANDGQSQNNTYSQTFMLTISAVNDAPAFTLSGNITVNEDFVGTQTVSATPAPVPSDEMSQTVVYSLSPVSVGFANVSINSTTGQVSITSIATANGSQVFTVTANDGQSQNNTYSQTFTLTVNAVNDAPAFTLSGSITVNEDFAGTQTVSASPALVPADEMSQTVIYSLSPASVGFANVSINSATGQVSITSVANSNGSQVFTVTANDGQSQNNTYLQTFTLTINAVNDVPAFTLSGNVTVNEDFAGTQTVSATPAPVPADEMNQTVVYSLSPASVGFANVSINSATGQVSITSIANANGSQLFTITANDGQSQNNTYSQTFTLTVNAVNDAPAFTLSGDITVVEGLYTSATEAVIPGLVPADEMSQVVTYSISPASISFANISINSATGEVTITPIADQFGTQAFTITANDGQSQNNTYSQTFTLMVDEGNNPPSFTISGDVNVNEDFATTQHVIVTPDPVRPHEAGQVVTYSLSPSSVSFANISFDSNTGNVTFTSIAHLYGSQQFTITADDHQGMHNIYSQAFTLTVNSVNDVPVFSISGNVTVNEDFTSTEYVSVTAGFVPADELNQIVSYSFSPASVSFANISFNSSTGQVTITSIADQFGSQLFTITANDGQFQNNTYSQTFTLTVNSVNDAPIFTLSGNVTVNEDFATAQHIMVTPGFVPANEQNQVVTYSLSPASVSFANVSINIATGEVTITSVVNANGSQFFTVTANDGQSQNNMYSQTFTLTVNAVNDAPAFTLSGDINVDEDFAAAQHVTVSPMPVSADEISQVVTYSLSPSSVSFANISINSATGEVTITAIANAYGSQQFTVTANDGQSQNNTYAQTFTLTVNSVNDAPAFTISGNITVNEDFAATQLVSVTPGFVPAGETNQVVTYSLSPASVSFANVSINSATGEVTITSVADVNGSQQFTVTADDGQSQNNTYSQNFTLTVNVVNDAPVFTTSGNVTVDEDFAAAQHVTVTPGLVPADEMSQTVVYSLSPSSVTFANVSINASTGEVTITSVADGNGSQFFTITANDGQLQNNTNTQTFTLTVNAMNDAPAFTLNGDITVNEDFPGIQTVNVTRLPVPADEQNQVVTYSISPAAISIANVSINPVTGEVKITAVTDSSGTQMFTVTATDGQSQNNIYTQPFTLTVNSVNDAPVFTITHSITVVKNFTNNLIVDVIPGPVPANELTQVVTYTLNPTSISFANVSFNNSTGTVSISSIPNMTGSQTFTITTDDGQSVNNLYAEQFIFSVIDTNYQPTLDAIADPASIDEDAGMQTTHLSGISAGFNETEAVTVSAVSDNPTLIPNPAVVYSNPNATGEVRYTPAADRWGVANITVTVDDGQSLNNKIFRSFKVIVNPVNDEPTINAIADMTILEDAGMQNITMTGITPGPFETDILTITAVSSNPSLIANPAVIYTNPGMTGSLQFAQAADQHGTAVITVTVNDGQAINNSKIVSFTVTVTSVNDAPVVSDIHKNGQEDKGIGFSKNDFVSKFFDVDGDALVKVKIASLPQHGILKLNNTIINVSDEIAESNLSDLVYIPMQNYFGADEFLWNGFDGQLYAISNANVFINLNAVNDLPFVVSHILDVTVYEDAAPIISHVNLDNIFDDAEDSGNLNYTVASNNNPALVAVIIKPDHSLDLSFIHDQNGIAQILIKATDTEGSLVLDTFLVTVISVEDTPTVFNLLTPENGSAVSISSPVNFTWESSVDADGDALTYTVKIIGGQLDTLILVVSATSLQFNGASVLKPNITYHWYVTVSDGQQVVASRSAFTFNVSMTGAQEPAIANAVAAYPNPFEDAIFIKYSLRYDSKVTLKIMNFLGQEIITLKNEVQPLGEYTIKWNGSNLASGVYYFEIMMETKSGMEGSFVGKIVKN